MSSAVQQFFATLALRFWEGRIDDLAAAYSEPLVVALPGEPGYVLASGAQLQLFFRLQREWVRQARIPQLHVDVGQVEATAPGRLVAWVEWYCLTDDGRREGETAARYYLDQRQDTFSIQMIEFERIAFPTLADWFHAAGDPLDAPPTLRLH